MITIHELGHYLAGKILHFKIKQFSIGFGPALYSRTSQKTGEKFAIRLLPLGGFCEFEGEDEKDNKNPAAFNNQKPWKRIVVLLSGALTNFVVSVLILITVFLIAGMFFPSVAKVYPQSTFDSAGSALTETQLVDQQLRDGDIILEVNGVFIYTNDLSGELSKYNVGDTLTLEIVRVIDGKQERIKIDSKIGYFLDSNGKIYTGLGIGVSSANYRMGFFETLGRSFVYVFKMAGVILSFFGQLISGKQSLANIGGPITTVDVMAQVARVGFKDFIWLIGLIGINLAVFNILPFPALDGARIVFVLIEWIFKKPVNRNVEAAIHLAGIIILFAFVIVVEIFHYLV